MVVVCVCMCVCLYESVFMLAGLSLLVNPDEYCRGHVVVRGLQALIASHFSPGWVQDILSQLSNVLYQVSFIMCESKG